MHDHRQKKSRVVRELRVILFEVEHLFVFTVDTDLYFFNNTLTYFLTNTGFNRKPVSSSESLYSSYSDD